MRLVALLIRLYYQFSSIQNHIFLPRYSYLGVLNHFFGSSVLRATKIHKLEHYRHGNFQFNFTKCSNELSDTLKQICELNVDGNNMTFVVQLGSWDLLHYNPNMISKIIAPLVFQFFNRINANVSYCRGLEHIIWVTTVSYRGY